MTALLPAFHASMFPFSSAKIKRAVVFGPPTRKLVVLLKTIPVGAAFTPGMLTTRARFTPPASYKVDLAFPLSETHQGLVGERAMPHGLTKSESVNVAIPGTLDTRFCWI